MNSNNPPYQPRTGLAARQQPAPNQPSFDQFAHQKPIDLFDPNFVGMGGAGQGMDMRGFGAQNNNPSNAMAGGGAMGAMPDLSQMSERDRRIFLRDQERMNRNKGGAPSGQSAYGMSEAPPVQMAQQPNLFGDAPVVPGNRRNEVWQQKMAQRQGSSNQLPQHQPLPPSNNLQPPPQNQNFTPSTQLNQQINMLQQPPSMNVPSMQQPSPNRSHRKLKAIGDSPLRKSNILTSAAAQQSPMRSSITAQKLQNAQALDSNIQQQIYGGAPVSQRHVAGGVGLPPSGASPAQRQDLANAKGGGLLDALSGNEANRRRQEQRAQQQSDYNQYLAQQQQQKPVMSRQNSAGVRKLPSDQGNTLAAGGLQMIGGYQQHQQDNKMRQQREYQQHLQDQMQLKQMAGNVDQLSDARKQQLSDQIFNEVVARDQPAYNYGSQQPQAVPMGGQMQHLGPDQGMRPGLPPRVYSAGRGDRRIDKERMQQQKSDIDPFHRNRQDESDVKRRELEKRKEYGAMLQAQMAQKKQNKQAPLPAPDNLFEQPPVGGAQQIQNNNMQQYPQTQMVDFNQFGRPPPQPVGGFAPQPGLQGALPPQQPFHPPVQDSRPKYSLDQPVSFDPVMPGPGAQQDPFGYAMQQQPAGPRPQQSANDQSEMTSQVKMQQMRTRQDEYRRELEAQMKLNDEKKRRMKEEKERYEREHDKDMAQYMGLQAPQQQKAQLPPPPGAIPGLGAPPPQLQQQQQQWDQISTGADAQAGQKPQAVRLGTDITKPQEQVDEAKQQAKQRYQEEIRQQMEEAKARKEAQKRKEKQEDEAMDRKIQAEQKRLAEQEVNEIKREGGKVPEVKENKKVRIDQFQPSTDAGGNAVRQNNFMEADSAPKQPAAQNNDLFTKPEPISFKPLQLNQADMAGPGQPEPPKPDLFGPGAAPQSLLTPAGGPSFGAPGFGAGGPAPLGNQQTPYASQYSQFGGGAPPPNMQLQAAQMASQSEWMEKQQQQASKMFEDQAKMVQMYQQALEQIMQYRQQSFEQAMAMRENMLKEREQSFENDKIKQKEMAEMGQIAALKNQLGYMLEAADQQQISMLNPQVANDLNQFLSKQKDRLQEMSQSQKNLGQLFQAAQNQPGRPLQIPQQEKELPVTSQQVHIPQPPISQGGLTQHQFGFNPSDNEMDMDLQKQVDDLAKQIAAGGVDQQKRQLTNADERRLAPVPALMQHRQQQQQPVNNAGEFVRNPDFEMSLSSESKMVKVPNQNLLAKAAQAAQISQEVGQPTGQYPTDMLTETWNATQAQKALSSIVSPVKPPKIPTSAGPHNILGLNESHQMTTPKRIGGSLMPRSPSISKTGMPQPIPELPHEEEKPQTNVDGMAHTAHDYFSYHANEKKSEYDFNNRALSGTSSPQRQFISIEAREEMDKIERLVQQQTQSGWAERRATMTGTSFYDNHRKTQKLQEQTQQEEMYRQLKRILDGTANSAEEKSDDPLKVMQEAYGPDTDREKNARDLQNHSSTVRIRASQDLIREPYQIDKDDKTDSKQVPGEVASGSKNPLAMTNFKLDEPLQANNNESLSEINIAATDQSGNNLRQMQGAGIEANSSQLQDTKRTFQASEVNNISGFTEPQQPSERSKWQIEKKEHPLTKERSVWDDPDLVPDLPNLQNQEFHQPSPPELSAYGNQQQFFMGSVISPRDKTLIGLQNMDPELIKTQELSQKDLIQDETSNNLQQSEFEKQFPQQRFQTYRQSEPMGYDVADSMPTNIQKSQSRIPTQFDVSQNEIPEVEEAKSERSLKQQREMEDIQDILRRAAQVQAVGEKTEKELALKRQLRADETGQSWTKPPLIKPQTDQINTPGVPSTGKKQLIGTQIETEKMQTAAADIGQRRLGLMKRAAEEIEPPPIPSPSPSPAPNNDQQILMDLDQIIANLENQQKKLLTLGTDAAVREDPAAEDVTSHHQSQIQAASQINIARPVTFNESGQHQMAEPSQQRLEVFDTHQLASLHEPEHTAIANQLTFNNESV